MREKIPSAANSSRTFAATEVVLEGELTVGKIRLVKGDVRVMKGGVGYGPLTSGPEGCRVLTIFDRTDGSALRYLRTK